MATVIMYSFEDAGGDEFGAFLTDSYQVATDYAQEYRLRIICNTYEWSDSELVMDYTVPMVVADEEEE